MDSFADFTNSDPFGSSPAGVLVGRYYQVNKVVRGTGADPTYASLYGGGLQPRFDRRDYRNGTVQQWNFFLERRFGSNWLLSAGYTASVGAHLPIARMPLNSDQLLPQELLDSWRTGYIARNGRSNPASEQIPNPIQPVSGPLIPFNGNQGRALISQREAAFPYPHFGSMSVQRSVGWSNYHAMILQVNRSFSNGLQINSHYTWSKALDMAQSEAQGNGFAETGSGYLGMDLRTYRNSYKYSYTDVPHRWVLTYVYELPFGVGKRFAPGNPVLSQIVSGWRTAASQASKAGSPYKSPALTRAHSTAGRTGFPVAS